MTPGVHLVMSWLISNTIKVERRERVLITLGGVAPDLDGLGFLVDLYNRAQGHSSVLYVKYHHVIGHNITAFILISALLALFAKSSRLLVFVTCMIAMHVHVLCDLVGSKGPDGYQWPIYYLYPLNKYFVLTWSGQWGFNSWQNQIIGLYVICLAIYTSYLQGHSPFEVLSLRMDREVYTMANKYIKQLRNVF